MLEPSKKWLDQIRSKIRLRHYSIRTEQSSAAVKLAPDSRHVVFRPAWSCRCHDVSFSGLVAIGNFVFFLRGGDRGV